MQDTNFVKEKLYARSPVVGVWSIINSPMAVEIAATAGLDFQIFDMEHGTFDLTSIATCIRACESAACSPLIRLPASQLSLVQNCFDMGAHGVILPQVTGYNEVLKFVQSTKFPPIGHRGYNPFTPAAHYNPMTASQSKLIDQFGLVSVIIENKKAYQELDMILSIPHLDLLYLGVYDMSVELGCAGNINHPDILEFVTSSISRIKSAGKFSGMMAMNQADMKKYLNLGVDLIVYGVDSYNYYSYTKNGVEMFNNLKSQRSPVLQDT